MPGSRSPDGPGPFPDPVPSLTLLRPRGVFPLGEQGPRRPLGGRPRSPESGLTTRGQSQVTGAEESRGPLQVSGSFAKATGESLSQSGPRKEALSSQPRGLPGSALSGGGPREV